jgi:elongation factor P hydroxylase
MAEQAERVSRALTAIEHWIAVDDALAGESYPDAQLLRERMRVAMSRWPLPDKIPERVRELGRGVEAYYETGENPRRRTL